MEKYKCAKYIRLSRADKHTNDSEDITNQRNYRNDSESVINQSKLIDDFVKNNPELEIVSERIDDGFSGIIFERPAFQEMMEDIKAGKINCVIVKDLSRLGREYIDTGKHLREIFPAYGVRFIAIIDNIDTLKESTDGGLAIGLHSIMNDVYSLDISRKTRSALKSKREHGKFIGANTIYGYMKSTENKNQLVVDEFASTIIKDIFSMKLEGISAVSIAEELNNSGVLSPLEYKKSLGISYPKKGYADKENSKWSATTIIRILNDETYTGTLIQGKKSTKSYKLKSIVVKPKDEWAITENAHDIIIPKQDFELVKRIMKLDTRTAPNKKSVYLFSGILVCDCCGSRMTRKTMKKCNKEYYYYFCPTGRQKGCTMPLVKENELTKTVWESLKSFIDNVISLDKLIHSISFDDINKKLMSACLEKIKSCEVQLDKVQQFQKSLYENLVNGLINKEEHLLFKKAYVSECKLIEANLGELYNEYEEAKNSGSEYIKWIEHFITHKNLPEINRKVVIHLIKSITIISKTHININFNYQLEYDSVIKLLPKQRTVI